MRKIWLVPFTLLLIPSLSVADVILFRSVADQPEQVIPVQQPQVKISYASTSLSTFQEPISGIKFSETQKKNVPFIPFFERIAEASLEPANEVIRAYLNAGEKLHYAWRMDDVTDVVSEAYLKRIHDKVDKGANPVMVLQMVQTMRPEKIKVLDARIDEMTADIALSGKSVFGQVYGHVQLVKEKAIWKIEQENWFKGSAGNLQPRLNFTAVEWTDLSREQELRDLYQDSRLRLTKRLNKPDYSFNRNPLQLDNNNGYAGYNRDEAFMFVFFVSKEDKVKTELAEDNSDVKKRHRIHVLWTGPDEILPEQKLVRDSGPVDVSIADEDDGYLNNTLNLRLPDDKPREICASFRMNF